MGKEKLNLQDEYSKFWSKLITEENFTLLRYGDGERAIMEGRSVIAQEGWRSPDEITKLGADLLASLNMSDSRIWYGISCPCCDQAAYFWYSSRINNKNITFANLWVNCNFEQFMADFEKLDREAVIIANASGKGKKVGKLKILKYYEVGDDCVNFWTEADKLIKQIIMEYGDRDNLLYVVSAGPMSEPFIMKLFKNNPNNCYIDFGSAIDQYIHGKITRPYMKKGNKYSQKICQMHKFEGKEADITVVCTLFKRPECLLKQIEAIENQTLKPKEILLFQDGIEKDYEIILKENVLSRFDNIKIYKENIGVWGRFEFARTSASPYVCIFDDDTIPGKRWLENCYVEMQKEEGVYGTVGIIFTTQNGYPFKGYYRVGWPEPYAKKVEADFVGHSWFIKREYLDYMFNGTDKYQMYKYAAEDMCLSVQCQKYGVKTFVPPHPYNNIELWGSLPQYANDYGKSIGALSLTSANHLRMAKAVKEFHMNGWRFLYEDNMRYVHNLRRKLVCAHTVNWCIVLLRRLKLKITNALKKKVDNL